MTEQTQIREALQNPEPIVRRFLTALYEANDFVTRGDLEKATGLSSRFISSAKTSITKRLLKAPGPPLYADNLFYHNGNGDLRLRPELWAVIGEVLGKRQEVRVSGMKIEIESVSRISVDQISTVTFQVFGLATQNKVLEVSVTVLGRSGNIRQVVEQACDILHSQLTGLASSAESLKEDLSQWE